MKKIITTLELQKHSDSELSALFREVSQDLAQSEPDSPERRNALANMENINRAMQKHRGQHFKPLGC